jgi:phage terminase large subunit GpA-like protein
VIPGVTPALDIYREAARAGARPDPRLLVSEWADEHRVLTTRSSPEPGVWRTSRTPFLKDIMDSLSPTSPWERTVFMKGSQIGATECGNNWIGYIIHLAPGPMLVVQPTESMAKRNSKQRIGPLIQDSPILRSLVRASRSRDSGNTILAKEFLGGILVLAGANSAKQLRSMAARYLFLDEVDGYPYNVDKEGDPCDLAIARTTNFRRKKIFIVSTPTISGRSRISDFFATSDQCYYFVPCQRCGSMITLEPEQLQWSQIKPHQAAYFCQVCEGENYNHDKVAMLPNGQWRPTAAGDGITRGYHLSSYYSPVGWLSWTQILRLREKAQGNAEKLQVFYNTILGLTWMEEGEVPDVDRLYERRESYLIGEVPQGGLVLTAGADVQINRIEVEVVAWGRDKTSWSVDYRVLEGNTNQPYVWRELAKLMDEEFPTAGGGSLRISKLAVDSGFNTMAVYDFVREMLPLRVMAIKGESHVSSLVGSPSLIEVGPGGRLIKGGVRLWPVNTNIAKEELYRFLRLSAPDLQAGENWPNGYCHFPSYSKEYFEQLCGEHLVTRIVMGQPKTHWEKRRDRNEALDCRIYARAAAVSLRMDGWSEQRWMELERSVNHPRPFISAGRPAWSDKPMPEFKPFRAPDTSLE